MWYKIVFLRVNIDNLYADDKPDEVGPPRKKLKYSLVKRITFVKYQLIIGALPLGTDIPKENDDAPSASVSTVIIRG